MSLTTAEQTVEAVANIASIASPQAATIAAIAPIAINLLNNAVQLTKAGAMTQDQLAGLFQTIGQGIQSTHNQWQAMTENKT